MDRKEDVTQEQGTQQNFDYGPWPWIIGLIMGATVIFALFYLSDSIS